MRGGEGEGEGKRDGGVLGGLLGEYGERERG